MRVDLDDRDRPVIAPARDEGLGDGVVTAQQDRHRAARDHRRDGARDASPVALGIGTHAGGDPWPPWLAAVISPACGGLRASADPDLAAVEPHGRGPWHLVHGDIRPAGHEARICVEHDDRVVDAFAVAEGEEDGHLLEPLRRRHQRGDGALVGRGVLLRSQGRLGILAEEDALRLRTELDQLKDELAQRPASPAEGWSVVPGGAMTSLDGTVLFDSGKAILKSAGRHTLDQVVRVILEEFPDHEVYIFGHTDSQPIRKSGWKDNYELSCQRALSVLRHLKDKGAMQYMAACGWGQHRPVADNRTAKARQANRRVEIFAMAPEEPMAGAARAGRP